MKLWLVLLLSISSLCATAEQTDAEHSLTIGGMSGFPLNAAGLEVLREAYAPLGYSLQVEEYPATRSLSIANNGQLDGEMGRITAVCDDYPNLVKVPYPLLQARMVAVTINPALKNTELKDLPRYRLGTYLGALINDHLKLPLRHTDQTRTLDQLQKMLESGRIDFAVTPDFMISRWQHSSDKPLYLLQEDLGAFDVYHYVHKRHQQLVPALSEQLQKLSAQGITQQILVQE